MMRNTLMMRTMGAGRAGRLRVALALAVAGVLSGCGGGSMFGASSDPAHRSATGSASCSARNRKPSVRRRHRR